MLQFLVLRRRRKLARTLFLCPELLHLSPEARERGVAIRRLRSLQRSRLPPIFTTIKKLTFGYFSLKNRLVPEKNHTLKFKCDKKYFFCIYINLF